MYLEIRQTLLKPTFNFGNFQVSLTSIFPILSLSRTLTLALSHILTMLVFGLEDYFNAGIFESSFVTFGFWLKPISAALIRFRSILASKENEKKTNFCFKGAKVWDEKWKKRSLKKFFYAVFFSSFWPKVSASELIFLFETTETRSIVLFIIFFLSLWANKQVGCFEQTNKTQKFWLNYQKFKWLSKERNGRKVFFGEAF